MPDGRFPKCWKRNVNDIYLYKAGTTGPGSGSRGNEPYSEVYACKIAEKLGIDAVKYTTDFYKGRLVSKCKCVTNEKIGLILYKDLHYMEECNFSKLLQNADLASKEQIRDMLLLDYVTCNVDRHYGNIGVFIENDTNIILGFAPLFDHNMSCLPYCMENDTEDYISNRCAKDGRTCVLTVPTNASDYYAYRKPLSDENEQTISFIVPAVKYSSQITIELLDSDERVIYSRTCTYQAYDEWQNMLLAGHMGKQTDTVSWPEQIKRSDLGTAVSVRTVTLTEDNLYTEKEGYDMLDFLSVDVAYFEELSSDVKNALLEWVKEGGTIVFEGSGGWTALQKMNINGFGSSKTFSAGSNQKLLYRSLGDGNVWFLGKTLSQTVSRLTDERKSQFILILSKGASGSYSEDFSSLSVYENSSLLYRLRTHKSSAETPKVWIYVAILILYLVVGIPGIYLLMRKKKRIRWFRPLVCLLAACFSILIFIVGTSTRYSRPFIRSLTVLSDENSRENENSETIYTSIQAPFNSSYEVSINPAYHVTSLMEEYYWGSGTQNGTVNAKRVVSFDFSKEQTLLSLENLTAFSSRCFALGNNISGIGTITGTVEENASGVFGTLVNNTEYELISAVVNTGNELALIEHWKPGETIDLETEQQNGRVHMMTKDQFSDGAYKKRGQWIGKLADYYEYYLYTKKEQLYVMAQIDYMPAIQQYTDYPVENDTIICLSVTQN